MEWKTGSEYSQKLRDNLDFKLPREQAGFRRGYLTIWIAFMPSA